MELAGPSVDALRIASYEEPRPQAYEVLVRLRAASLNFLDIAVARGLVPVPFPIVAVTDGAGEIVEKGVGVDRWAVGDRIVPHFMPDWHDGTMTPDVLVARRGLTRPGSLAEYVAVPAASLVAIPNHLSFVEASTLPIAATTAWRAVRAARLGPGSTALLLGTGGVSIFALAFAKAHGANVIITSSSDEKLERARKLGADQTINYLETAEWDTEALRLTDGRGADLVLETGGADTFPRSLNAAAMAGTVFVIGFLSGTEPCIDVLTIIEKGLHIQGNNAGSVADLAAAAAAIVAHRITPIVDRVFAMDDAANAYEHLATNKHHFAKIALNVDEVS